MRRGGHRRRPRGLPLTDRADQADRADRAAVRWIGGGSGAGKTTVARRLAADHGLHLLATDDVMADHAARLAADEAPLLARFAATSPDERWVDRPPAEMLATFHWFAGEGFDHVADDVRSLALRGPVLVDGFRLLPHLVAPLLAAGDRAVWLLPTPGFRRAAFARRADIRTLVERTSDPGRALANLLARDQLFTEHLRAECTRLHLATIEVAEDLTEDALTAQVAEVLALG